MTVDGVEKEFETYYQQKKNTLHLCDNIPKILTFVFGTPRFMYNAEFLVTMNDRNEHKKLIKPTKSNSVVIICSSQYSFETIIFMFLYIIVIHADSEALNKQQILEQRQACCFCHKTM